MNSPPPAAGGGERYSQAELFFGEVGRKIQIAHRLASEVGASLLANPEVRSHLYILARRWRLVRERMVALRLGACCQACAVASPTGGCCSRFMSGESDALLLLLNLLVGRQVNRAHSDHGECCFLGGRGCDLRYKPFFCLNYLCTAINTNTTGADLAGLALVSGQLLQAQYATEQLLLAILQERGFLRH